MNGQDTVGENGLRLDGAKMPSITGRGLWKANIRDLLRARSVAKLALQTFRIPAQLNFP